MTGTLGREPQDELVYVVPRSRLMGDPGWHGVRRGDPDGLLDRIALAGAFVRRAAAELDRNLKQIIPYLVLRDGERIFLMQRTRAGGDERLHDLYSIGVGGHLNPVDGGVRGGLRREWHEELDAAFEPELEFLGLLNDDTTGVGSVHLGVVYQAQAAGRPVRIRETDKLRGSFESPAAASDVYPLMETWSQLVLDAILSGGEGGPPEPDRPSGVSAAPRSRKGSPPRSHSLSADDSSAAGRTFRSGRESHS